VAPLTCDARPAVRRIRCEPSSRSNDVKQQKTTTAASRSMNCLELFLSSVSDQGGIYAQMTQHLIHLAFLHKRQFSKSLSCKCALNLIQLFSSFFSFFFFFSLFLPRRNKKTIDKLLGSTFRRRRKVATAGQVPSFFALHQVLCPRLVVEKDRSRGAKRDGTRDYFQPIFHPST